MPVLVPDTAADYGLMRVVWSHTGNRLAGCSRCRTWCQGAGAVFSNGDAGRDSTGLISVLAAPVPFSPASVLA